MLHLIQCHLELSDKQTGDLVQHLEQQKCRSSSRAQKIYKYDNLFKRIVLKDYGAFNLKLFLLMSHT